MKRNRSGKRGIAIKRNSNRKICTERECCLCTDFLLSYSLLFESVFAFNNPELGYQFIHDIGLSG